MTNVLICHGGMIKAYFEYIRARINNRGAKATQNE